MEKYKNLNKLNDKSFKRIIGVKRETYKIMLEEFKRYEKERKKSHGIGGRKPKLCEEDKVLFMLEYYREYRTLAHMGFDYGISEAVGSKLVREVESVLIKSGKFSLPSKRALYKSDIELDYILVDVTEMPIQRPKKSKE
jgi:hypothetical protein